MDINTLINNITRFAAAKNESPSGACIAAGINKNFVSELKRNRMPSVATVATLAEHLEVSVSDLVGDAMTPAELAPLAAAWEELNDEGRAALIQHANLLVNSGMYIKNHLSKEA